MLARLFGGKMMMLGLIAAVVAQPAVIYQVTVTTASPLNGASGIVEMQFNPGGSSQAATAVVSSFSGATPGMVEPDLPGNGVVTGNLSTSVSFTNTAALNDIAQDVVFGPLFQFILTLDGPAITAPNNGLSGTRFSLSLWEPNFANPLVTMDGLILTIDINPDGSITIDRNGIVSVVDASGTPEPATWTLCAGALAGYCLLRRRTGRS